MFTRLLLKRLAQGLDFHQVPPLRLLLLCLTFASGSALAGELFRPYTPPSLTAVQIESRDWWIKQPGFKSITNIKVNSAGLKSNVITVTLKGETYHIKGEAERHPAVVGIGQRQVAGIHWMGQSENASGNYLYSDEGHFIGYFAFGGKYYEIAGSDGMCMANKSLCFLVEIPPADGPEGRSLALFRSVPTVLSAAQESAQENYYNATGFKTIETIQIDRTVLNLHSSRIALTVKGKRYSLGNIGGSRYDRPVIDARRELRHASWADKFTDNFGRVDVSDDGRIVGEFSLGGHVYRVMSGNGMDFLLQSDKPAPASAELFQPIPMPVPLNSNQERFRAGQANLQGFKSMTTVQVNKAAVDSNVIKITVKGETYRLYLTQPKRRTDGSSVRPGYWYWHGEGDGFGSVTFYDDGQVTGSFSLRKDSGGGNYGLASAAGDDVVFLIEGQ